MSAELVRVFLEYVDFILFMFYSAPGRIAVEGRWPWRTTVVFAGSASRCAEAVQNDAARGRRRDTGQAYPRRHRGASVDKVSFILPLLGGRPPAWLEEPCVVRGTIHKELVDGLAVELQVKGHHIPRTGKGSQG